MTRDFVFIILGSVSALMPLAKQCAFEEPSVETISGENVLTWPHVVILIISRTVFLIHNCDFCVGCLFIEYQNA